MSDRPQGPGSCCGGSDERVTQLRLYDDGRSVGILGLAGAFAQLRMRARGPEEVSDQELLEAVRAQHNYIVARPQVEARYAAALRREYAAFCARPPGSGAAAGI